MSKFKNNIVLDYKKKCSNIYFIIRGKCTIFSKKPIVDTVDID